MRFLRTGREKTAVDKSAMDVYDDVIALIGNTPMVRVDRVSKGLAPTILAKLEYLNPGGSVKDRPALTMIEDAERRGLLKPGGTIVEPTSGNTGVGLAIVAARRGYKCIFTCPDKVAPEKVAQLRAYGAKVVVCPTAVEPDDPQSYYSVSTRLANEIDGAFKPDQYSNPANPQAHYETTGPEIWEQTAGRVTHVVAGVGTAGTIGGIARYLKERNSKIQIVGADPEGSVYSGGPARPYLVEGVGEDFFPGNYDAGLIDRVITVSDADSFAAAHRMTREEAIFIGGSGGMAVSAALELAKDCNKKDVIVVLIPDSGRGYLSKIYSNEWMSHHGFDEAESTTAEKTVGAVIDAKGTKAAPFIKLSSKGSVREAVGLMRTHGVTQVLVVDSDDEHPVLGEMKGVVNEDDLLGVVFKDSNTLNDPVALHMAKRPDPIGVGESIDTAIAQLGSRGSMLAMRDGRPVALLTGSDVLAYVGASTQPAK